MERAKEIPNMPKKGSATEKKKRVDSQIETTILKKPVVLAKDKAAAILKKDQFEYDHQMVRGIFRFHECAGGNNAFFYRKYREDQVKKYDFWDGQIYEIPRMVADHLNDNCKNVVYKYSKRDGMHIAAPISGSANMYAEPGWEQTVGSHIDRMSFQVTGKATGEYEDKQGMHGIAMPAGVQSSLA